ncbi:flavodoxin [Neobacillus niacini]|uniref:flavodoxin n=1 Tax=Neobacillus niacini TaxID=86668 RepID=UPI0028614F32|nr:flavodoxin [Neobacillus niacini]MDR7002454.1 flavodoxin I [Neobacillus niacini]
MNAACLIVYASMTGNTEELAQSIGKGICQAGGTVEIKDILEADVKDLKNYDGILLGSYTWGDGDLADEFLDFYEEMDGLDLTGKIAAAFGSCDSTYEHRGRAVDILSDKLLELGADVVADGLKIDLAPTDSEIEQCTQFGEYFVKNHMRGVS